MNRLLLTYRGKANEKEVITEDFMKRYNLIKELVSVEEKALKATAKYDQVLVAKGGAHKVPPEVLNKRNALARKIGEMAKQLSELPPLKAKE